MFELTEPLHIGRVVLQNGEAAVADKEGAITHIAHIPNTFIPLTFILDKFNIPLG